MQVATYTPSLRLGRLYAFQLASILLFDLIVVGWFLDARARSQPMLWIFLVVVTFGFPLLAANFCRQAFTPMLSPDGIKPHLRTVWPWSAPCQVARGFPGLFVLVSGTNPQTGLPISFPFPVPSLVVDREAYMDALARFAPNEHPILRLFRC